MEKIVFASMLFCLLCMSACSRPEALTGKDAERIGMERYTEFIKEQNLSPEQFEKPSLSYSAESQGWLLNFESKGSYPEKSIGIMIDRYGGTEISFQD